MVLAVVTFVAYQPVWHAGFIWDDNDHLTANPAVAASNGLQMIWSSLAVSRYYPLTLTAFWVQRRLWGLNPAPYHLVNIALHAVNGILVFLVLRRLRVPSAWLAATLWVLHPVNVESVAWITELKNTQSGLFFFLSILCLLRFDADHRPGWYALAIACGLAAMLSKPSTVVLPVVLLLYAWWQRGRWRRADIARIAPFFILAVGMSALTIIEQRGHILRAGTTEWRLGPAQRLVIAGKAIWFYAAKILWPVRLTFVYPRWEIDALSLWSWVPTVAVVALGATLWWCRSRAWCRAVLLGIGFFVVALLPVLGFFDVYYFQYSFVADHFQYLACLGLISLAVSTGTGICARAGQWGRSLGTLAAVIVLLILGMSTWRQARIYQNMETLWRDTLAKNPAAWMAHNNLSDILIQQGKIEEAIGHLEQAQRLKPDDAVQHSNLGLALEQAGRVREAIGHYEQALRIKPDYAAAHSDLGLALARVGKPQEAMEHLEEALRLKPDLAEAHCNLGIVLAQTGRVPEAIEHFEQALRIEPDDPEAHCNLGKAFLQEGRLGDAIGQYEQALRIKPDDPKAHYGLGKAFLQEGRLSDAIGQYEQALRTQPDSAETHYNLGNALAQADRVPEAVVQYEQALRLKPDFAEAQNALARLQARQ